MNNSFDPATLGYPLRADFDRLALEKLLGELIEVDHHLARHLRAELLDGSHPQVSRESFERLRELCPTNGTYDAEEELGRTISELLFGKPLAK